jgi:hypothetical protein
MNKFKINIQGMTCTGCEEHLGVLPTKRGKHTLSKY